MRSGGVSPFAIYAANGFTPDLIADIAGVQGSATYTDNAGGNTFDSVFSFSRAGVAHQLNSGGSYSSVADGVPRTGHHYANGITFIPDGMMFEPAPHNNIIQYSTDFTNDWWQKTRLAPIAVDAVGSDGVTVNATTIRDDGAGETGSVRLQKSMTLPSSGDWVLTAVVKADGVAWLKMSEILFDNGVNSIWFDISSGTVGHILDVPNTNAFIRPMGNGFFECSLKVRSVSDLSGFITIEAAENNKSSVQPRDGTTSIIVEKITMTNTSVPASYVETSGGVGAINAETLSIPSSNTSPSTTALSMFIDVKVSRAPSEEVTLMRWAADASNSIEIGVNTSNEIFCTSTISGTSTTVTGSVLFSPEDRSSEISSKIAVRLSSTGLNISVDGKNAAEVSIGGIPDLDGADIDFLARMTLSEFRVWMDADISDAGINEVTGSELYLFGIAGQSNMIGRVGYDFFKSHARNVFEWDEGEDISFAAIPLDGHFNERIGDMGPDIEFGRSLITARPRAKIIFVPKAQGSTGFSTNHWNDGNGVHEDFVARMNAAILSTGKTPDGILWHLGESDAFAGRTEVEFSGDMDAAFAAFRASITSATNIPIVIGQIGSFLDTEAYTTRDAINAAIIDTPNRLSNIAESNTSDLTAFDGVHFDAASVRLMGERYYNAWVGLR